MTATPRDLPEKWEAQAASVDSRSALPQTSSVIRRELAAELRAALAAMDAKAVAWQINATQSNRGWEPCTRECYEDTLRTGRYMGFDDGTKDVLVRSLFTPPAVGVDEASKRVAAEMREFVEQEVEPELDLIEQWAAALEAKPHA